MKMVACYSEKEFAEQTAQGLQAQGIACRISYQPGEFDKQAIPSGGPYSVSALRYTEGMEMTALPMFYPMGS